MGFKKLWEKYENWIGTAALLLVLMVFVGLSYDYYYDLNDDVLMKDILSGVYTGEPEGHNIQMLWLISAFVSLLYRTVRQLPWYGLFLCFCQYGSLALIIHRSLEICRTKKGKIILLLTEGLLFTGLYLNHLTAVQYTLVCTLIASVATFLFMTTDITLPAGKFIRKNTGAVLLVSLAYLIRSEMLLLVLPMICAAGIIKWGSEEKIFTWENARKYFTVIGAILVGILIGQISHMIAYGSDEWRKFTEYFDNRTELYDFQELPEYGANREFYDSIGLTESERELLSNYNFGLDEEIDEKLLGEIAVYAATTRSEETPFLVNLKISFGNYVRRTLYGPSQNESDYPWNYVILFSYMAVFVTALLMGEEKLWVKVLQIGWKLVFLGAVRSSLWMYIIMRGRDPARIMHSLYLMELCILGAMLLLQCGQLAGKGKRGYGVLAVGAGYFMFSLWILPWSISVTEQDLSLKAENNVPYQKLYRYLGSEENKENFYFIDVYSSVSYTEKMFAEVDNSLDNYDIMGGWACKSPLWRKKLAAFGIDSMEQALTNKDDVYYVQEAGADTSWLKDYYADRDVSITLELTETVGDDFEIWKIRTMRLGKSG